MDQKSDNSTRAVFERLVHALVSSMPRISIRHLLLCMTVCALLFSRARILGGLGQQFSPLRIFSIILSGAAVTAALVIANACRKGFEWRSTDPGHWCAFVATWEVLESAIVHQFLLFITGGVEGNNVPRASDLTLSVFNSIAFIGIAFIFLVGLAITKWPIYWRIPVALHALDAINAAIWRLTSEADSLRWLHVPDAIYLQTLPIVGVLAAASLVVATATDIYKKEFRNWPHWVGLVYEFVHWYWIVSVYL